MPRPLPISPSTKPAITALRRAVRAKHLGWVVLVPLLLGPACDRKSPPPAATPARLSAAAQPKPPPPDRSLEPEEYVKLGMPAWDREWVGADMVRAGAVITALAAKSPDQLPRFGSQHSGKVFARMTSPENFSFHHDKSLPLNSRFGDLLTYLTETSAIFKKYFAAFADGKMGQRDLAELNGSLLYATASELALVDELLPTISKDDPSFTTRMRGLEQMKQGVATVVSGSLTTLTEKDHYPAPDRVALIGHLKQTLPTILPHLTDSSRLETVTRIKELCADGSLKDLQPAINELLEVATTSAPQPAK